MLMMMNHGHDAVEGVQKCSWERIWAGDGGDRDGDGGTCDGDCSMEMRW